MLQSLVCADAVQVNPARAQTVGLKDGNTVVLCTCAAVSSMVTGAPARATSCLHVDGTCWHQHLPLPCTGVKAGRRMLQWLPTLEAARVQVLCT
jgi:hypothetical protein